MANGFNYNIIRLDDSSTLPITPDDLLDKKLDVIIYNSSESEGSFSLAIYQMAMLYIDDEDNKYTLLCADRSDPNSNMIYKALDRYSFFVLS